MKYEKALFYFYNKAKKTVREGKVRGLKAKHLMDYIKIIEDLQFEINQGQVKDLEEVLNYDN